jgi:hypothetical protein
LLATGRNADGPGRSSTQRGHDVSNQVYQRADAFVFGRRTYEIFAGYWGAVERSGHPIAGALNTQPKLPRIDHAHRAALGEHDPPLR